nr:unnamed protein product [Digitaria exilis]
MSKRRRDYSSSSNEKQKANRSPGNSDLDDSSHVRFSSFGVTVEMHRKLQQKLCESVVSLSFIGDREAYQYTGLVIKSGSFGSRFVTSATAIRSKEAGRNINTDMSIRVSLPNGEMALGYLLSVDFDYNIAVIGSGPFPVLKEASLDQPGGVGDINVAAIYCNSTGQMMISTGFQTMKSINLCGQNLIMSKCIIPEFGIGGPLVDSDGNFIGMNMSCVNNEGTLFLPIDAILVSIVPYWLPSTSVAGQAVRLRARIKIKQRRDNQIERSSSEICKSSTPAALNSEAYLSPHHKKEKGIGSDKSPQMSQKSSVSPTSDSESESSQDTSDLSDEPLPDNEFMKAFTNDLLSRGYPLPKMLDGDMKLRRNFEEEFSEDIWNRLPEKVALDTSLSVVSLASFRGETRFFACTGVLIGRHKSIARILTSASLVRFSNKNEIDSSLKAGIGGPLIDFCGNFIGMNFYGAKRTPYLPKHIILEQLKDFDRKGSAAAKINKDSDPNRFSVPGPYWWYPSLAPRFIFERWRRH